MAGHKKKTAPKARIRRRRIAADCGMEVQDVNRLIKQFREAQKMMKMFQKTGGKGLGRMFG